ncbi:PHP domain-containing protein [Blastococcus sp. PRF04-17]|uniref:PHP domain-containing protein n=1 Tax=Blastococcus sp. PRF04-17 TaxID=2933797 RepID=UPI001FF4C17D|nr:PHP domain-containing protein [Blastococcus sp. PRF04-17]UOY02931.1 PHP domain-containing protein [Blastococcus sp. PRF04-17]
MNDPFVHLHVASGYSMQFGANHPADLVARAAEHGMSALALTDRDGLYGTVKFALACRSAGVRPIFGVDLAVAPAADTALAPPLARPVGEGSGRRGCRPRPGGARPGAGRASIRACRGSPSSPATAPAGGRCAG